MVKFIFEPMIPADIASTLMGWGIPCNEQQLAAPTQKFVESVYLNCLDQLTKLSADELHPYVQAAMENVGITDHVRLRSLRNKESNPDPFLVVGPFP